MQSIKSAVSIVLSALSLSSLSACSALDSFRKVQDDFFHDTIGMSSGDPQYDAVRSELKDKLYGIEREKLNLILDDKLVASQKTADVVSEALNILHLYTYQTEDCNLVFEFDADDKFNMFRQLTPEVCISSNVTINGNQANPFQSALAKQAWEQEHAYKAGECRILKNAVNRFIEKGGNDLTVDAIKTYLAEDAKAAEEAKQIKQNSDTITDLNSALLNRDVLNSDDAKDLREAVQKVEEMKRLLKQAIAESPELQEQLKANSKN